MNKNFLLWVDLEMTGLNPIEDRILEIAAIVTDYNFKEIATFESGVGDDISEIKKLLDANEFYNEYVDNKQQLLKLVSKSPRLREVEQNFDRFIEQHFGSLEKVILAGNSIHQDRLFIRNWLPAIERKLHYRMLDVSSFKIIFENKFDLEFVKNKNHRALDDIRESLGELQYYLKYFKETSIV